MSRRRKILLLQPSLQPPGGGNGVAAWMIEALKSDYALSVLTCWPIDLAAVNRLLRHHTRPDRLHRSPPPLGSALSSTLLHSLAVRPN